MTIDRYRRLGRRQLLRGLGAFGATALALPLLDVMLDGNGEALADGAALPVRVGVWFWGNGLRPEHFFPQVSADNLRAVGTPGTVSPWDPSLRQHTKPLADAGLAPYVSLATGTRPFATPAQAHHDGRTPTLTGSYEWFQGDPDRGYAGAITPSIDQLAAEAFAGLTPFKSLVLGVQEGAANNEPGYAGHFTSTTGGNVYVRPEFSPLALFQRLFMDVVDPSDEAAQRLLLARRSVLDAVGEDIKALNRELGARDRMCLDQHLSAVRQLETRLTGDVAADCVQPGAPPLDWPTVGGVQRLRDRSDSMSEVLALALACDLTRAFSYQFTIFETGHDFAQEPELNGQVESVDPENQLDESTSFHEAAHDPGFQDNVRIVTNFVFSNLAYTLKLLAERPEGDGTVLSNCAILATSEHTEPVTHSTDDIPLILAGRAGGRLQGGLWYHGDRDKERVSQGGLTILRAAGVALERFGVPFNNGEGPSDPSTTETFRALETP
ncbi:MAG: DUF1552 domain-containing protein [Myxococcales bacterium]|nr:DUF1552 domain-containing protein [Myxococcales bacterium]